MLGTSLKLEDLPQGVVAECNQYYTTTFDNYGVGVDGCETRYLNYTEKHPIEAGHKFLDPGTLEPRTITESELSECWYKRGFVVQGIIDDTAKTFDVRSVTYTDAVRSEYIVDLLNSILAE